MGKRRIAFFLPVLIAGFVAAFSVISSPVANALSGSEFQPGRIIDNSFFFHKDSMNAASIQSFLNSKVPTCDTNGDQPYPGYANRREYSASRGVSTPFTCLKDYRENTPTKSAETGLCGAYGGGNNSAAEIIFYVSQICGINPQVLIVLLQKEQSLITDDWPWPIQYRSATGYGCPDTAPCDSEYYGFFNQVYNAARQFKRYERNANLFTHRANNTSFIQYNPNASCGGTNVYIQNQATANLYNYTPYQPNASALSNLYGSGDSCGAYGNRNFWRMWRDWFGPTMGKDYDWSYAGISFSTGSSNVVGNTKVTITVSARNTGNQSWSDSNFPVRLATFAPTNHASALYDSTWVNATQLATVSPSVVMPNEIGTFTFVANIPNRDGAYYERFNLVSQGVAWFPDPEFSIQLNISKSTYKWQMVSQSSTTGFSMLPGATSQFTLVAKNTGNTTWSKTTNPVRLATWAPSYRTSPFDAGDWVSAVRAATLSEASVAPGQNGTFVFNVRAPNQPGFYVERFNLVAEGAAWFEDPWMEFNINVGRQLTWQMVSQSSNKGFALTPGETAQFTLVAKNTGNSTWNNSTNPVRLATWEPSYRTSKFDDGSWVNQFRAANLVESSVAPGQNGTFVFNVRAPNQPGFYVERFNLVMEGLGWFVDPWMEFNIHVRP